MITSEVVEKACSQVGEYSDETMTEDFERFFREQPAVCDFVVELDPRKWPANSGVVLVPGCIWSLKLCKSAEGHAALITRDALEIGLSCQRILDQPDE